MANKATARNVDFSGVKDGGNFNKKRIPAGDYLATVTKVEDAVAKDKTPQYLFSIKINKYPSSVLPYYCKLQENQLWKLRNLLIAAGKSVPKSKQKVDPNVVVGKTIGVSIEDTEYEGKDQSEVGGVFPAAELADMPGADEEVVDDSEEDAEDEDSMDDMDMSTDTEDEAEEDEAEEEADDEEEEADQGDEYDAMDRTALKAELKKRDASFQARKSQSDDDLRALLRTASGDTEEEDEEEEPEPAPKPAARKKKAKPSAADIDDEELDELDIDSI